MHNQCFDTVQRRCKKSYIAHVGLSLTYLAPHQNLPVTSLADQSSKVWQLWSLFYPFSKHKCSFLNNQEEINLDGKLDFPPLLPLTGCLHLGNSLNLGFPLAKRLLLEGKHWQAQPKCSVLELPSTHHLLCREQLQGWENVPTESSTDAWRFRKANRVNQTW